MKKGLSYIDWVISIGLFIVFLVIIFIIFQPAITGGEDKEYLTTIVKQGLEDFSFVTLDVYPVFIDVGSTAEYNPVINNFPKTLDIDQTFVVVENGSKIGFEITGTNTIKAVGVRLYDYKTNRIWIVNSDQINNGGPGVSFGGGHTNLSRSIGINEPIYGFYPDNFQSSIEGADYNHLKGFWRYPQNKDFDIYIYDATDLDNPIWQYAVEEPARFDSVRTLFYSAKLLEVGIAVDKPVKQVPIFILIRVW